MKKTERKAKDEKGKDANGSFGNLENCNDRNCNLHGALRTRGKVFEGRVVKKLHKRVAIEFERMIYVRKYERYAKSKTKVHARLPDCIKDRIEVGDLIRIQECRPLSKIIHFVVVSKVKGKDEK